ncbi:MAG: hypothetical protein NUV47_00750 [Patescibacteria group bacterium]|nr:hypothetical protein [Patescibacteria group bacterium]
MENQKIGLIFEGDTNISPSERVRVENELRKIGKMLTFKFLKNENGWMAECNEIDGVIAGGTNTNPTDSEIKSQIRESIYAAFSVEIEETPFFSFQEFKQQETPAIA